MSEEIENLHTKFANFQQLVATQHGELMDALNGLSVKLSQIIAAIVAIPPGGTDMSPTNAILNEMADILGTISSSIGVPDADLPVNALTWLDHIAANTLRQAECCEGDSAPPTNTTGGCTNPLTSTGATSRMVEQGTYGGQGVSINMFTATFPVPLSSDIVGDVTEGLQYENMYLAAPRNGWDGYKVYVESNAPNYADNFEATVQYKTNEWRNLSGTQSLIFSVYPGNSIKVYICTPGDNGMPIVDCVTLNSQVVSINPRPNTKSQVDAIIPPGGFATDNTITYPGYQPYVYGQDIVILDDMYGYSVGLTAGAAVLISGVADDSSIISHTIASGDAGYVFNQHTTHVIFVREVNTGTPDGPFSIELCPPEPQ